MIYIFEDINQSYKKFRVVHVLHSLLYKALTTECALLDVTGKLSFVFFM